MTGRTLNRELAAARGRAATFEGLLAKAWAAVITRTGQAAAEGFAATATVLVAATNPEWVPPDTAGLFDTAVTEKAAGRTRRARERALDAAGTVPGVAFDVKGRAPQAFLDRLGSRADQVIAGIRPAVARAIQQGFEDGLSVADTAALIREEVGALTEWQAAMLARTDLVALANAGNHLAVQQHNAAAVAAGERSFTVKTWRTADDERVREAHADAEGQTVPVEQPFIVDGERLNFPGDPFGSDANVLNCRCTATFHEQTETQQLAASAAPEAGLQAAAVDFTSGSMVAVYPTAAQADALALPGGQSPETLHCTLAFLPDGVPADLADETIAALAAVANDFAPLDGTAGGAGAFAEGPDGYPLIVLPDCVGLDRLRVACVAALEAAGVVVADSHGFCPHVTLDYATKPNISRLAGKVGLPLSFDALTLERGPDRTDLPLAGKEATMKHDLQAATVVVVNETDDTQPDTAAAAEAPAQRWQADIAPEGSPTDDGRIMMPGSLTWRQPPLTLLALTENTEAGHLGADSCGSMQTIVKQPLAMAGTPPLEQAMVSATGVFDSGELGQETARMVAEGTLGGVSVDLAIREYAFRDPGTGEMFDPLTMNEEEWLRAFMGGLQFAVLDGVIGAATIVPFAAFGEARIALTASAGEVTATLYAPIRLTDVLTACAAGPIAPPADWFGNPGLDALTPLTVTADGRVYGHAATWDCHNGFADRCLRATPSSNGYAQFHTGQLRLADGDAVRVGRVTVKPHAPYLASPAAVSQHYDDASRVAAFVRCYDDAYGIAVAGVTRSDAPAELLRDFLANPPSGDWRGGELLGFSSVPHPGLPVVVPEARLVASADGEAELDVLLLPAVSEADVLFASITGDGPGAAEPPGTQSEIELLALSIVRGS